MLPIRDEQKNQENEILEGEVEWATRSEVCASCELKINLSPMKTENKF